MANEDSAFYMVLIIWGYFTYCWKRGLLISFWWWQCYLMEVTYTMMTMTMLTNKEWPSLEKIGCLIWFSGDFPQSPSFKATLDFTQSKFRTVRMRIFLFDQYVENVTLKSNSRFYTGQLSGREDEDFVVWPLCIKCNFQSNSQSNFLIVRMRIFCRTWIVWYILWVPSIFSNMNKRLD